MKTEVGSIFFLGMFFTLCGVVHWLALRDPYRNVLTRLLFNYYDTMWPHGTPRRALKIMTFGSFGTAAASLIAIIVLLVINMK